MKRLNGQPGQKEMEQLINQTKSAEFLRKLQNDTSIRLGNVIVSLLGSFAPQTEVGLSALTNVLASTCVRHKVSLETLNEQVAQAYRRAADAQAASEDVPQPSAEATASTDPVPTEGATETAPSELAVKPD